MSKIMLLIWCVSWFSAWASREGMDRDSYTMYTVTNAALEIAPEYGIDPLLMLAVAEVESEWNPFAGRCGDGVRRGCGVYQQVPEYSGMWADKCWHGGGQVCGQPGGEPYAAGELLDVYVSTEVAARHLRHLLNRYSLCDALTAYNTGEGGMRGADRSYCRRVLNVYGSLREG